ncbi:LysR family transcriptional regulator [Mesorhizobium sp.]|uniref:LysR family transcriptional regulator n=1 Tax=Mesorhizobium sp. TaxID=1871066 RepID=UPI000FE33FD4|nr:LysR family transcriptional regulator [Mesorhizobium sp.]RWA75104.1 MAG: LysR family transcriptional regulator [Mesorhizobium sp.]RWC03832.1 MAG: LysR family transcriptional regulator [Mesorhizobium sp.]RWG91127.1 MAG: LysR family transcriptional regulator [Mesorhizobium sp.]RWK10018.1 MAG: LysR family transcriptional regulator [Mesorhizobium sp.]RWK11189.1 MAG: LysR family transcriptional regulator [Mesorhizobium sp.]
MDRLESMEVFVRAVDLGSFAAAAAALDLSGPMVGKHVRFLEERLGVRLLNRTTRRQSLTDFGRAYYERCRIVLAEAQAADALAAEQLSEPRGKLRVTMPAHFGRHCVTPILLALARRYPTLELDLSLSDRFADLVEDGFDLAIRTGALDDRAGIIARRVARQRMIVCASPSYLERIGRPLRLDDIAGHQAIIYRRLGQALQPWLFPRDGGSVTQIAPAGRLRLDDLDAIADAATDGMGLAWLPYWLVRERVEAGALIRLLPDQPDYLYDCHALWLQTPHLPLKVRLAIDALAAGLPRMMS